MAQIPSTTTEQQMEAVTENNEDNETQDDSFLQSLQQFLKNPVNMNTADAATLKETSRISVQDNNGMLSNVNELEWIDNYIYSNVWETNYILKIDPATGIVIAKADITQQIKAALPPSFDSDTNVLNGIAYDAATKKIYITGKNWPKLFEVKFN